MIPLLISVLMWVSYIDADDCVSNCSLPYNRTNEVCEYYKNNEDWLPTAYAESAYCACNGVAGLFDSGWHSGTCSCVRGFLIHAHNYTVQDSLKTEMSAMKEKFCNSLYCDPTYFTWVEENWIPIVYDIHNAAYRACCCPEGPAPYVAWAALMFNYKGSVGCDAIVLAIEAVGACGCEGWFHSKRKYDIITRGVIGRYNPDLAKKLRLCKKISHFLFGIPNRTIPVKRK